MVIMDGLGFLVFFGVFQFVYGKDDPKFIGPSSNSSVVVGRDAALACMVENLQNYKVAWLRVDTQTILTIGGHVITKNHRVSVSNGDPQVWVLTLRNVRLADGGRYMCQINTEPMITQTHLLQVFVPPNIVDNGSSEVTVVEGEEVALYCAASGVPQPTITWRREDFAPMKIGNDLVSKWTGTWLNMTDVSRELNTPLLCIATNGVPPSVSKRILLHVLCKPSVRAAQKMVGSYIEDTLVLQCKVESNPPPFVYWTHIFGKKLQNGTKYQANMKSNSYKHTAVLIIHDISREDVGVYYCHAENLLGSDKDDVTVYTLAATTVTSSTRTTISSTPMSTTLVVSSSLYEDTTMFDVYEEFENRHQEDVDTQVYEKDNFIIVSQHRMQNSDLSASS